VGNVDECCSTDAGETVEKKKKHAGKTEW